MRHRLLALLLFGIAGSTTAGEPASGLAAGDPREFAMADNYRFDARAHELDGFTRLSGWRLSRQWYFGRKRGEDPGLAFVWQRNDDQMSISTGGIRFTRRF